MDKKRAEYLLGIAQREQRKAFLRWTGMSARVPEYLSEQARLECAAWAIAAKDLYKLTEEPAKAGKGELINHA